MREQYSSSRKSRTKPQPNPATRRRHRREVLWQITVPMIVGVLAIAGLAVGLARGEVGGVTRWAEISTMLILLPVLALALFPLALLGVIIYAVTRMLGLIPPYARQVQDSIQRLERRVKRGADLSVEPLLRLRSLQAMIRSLFRRERGIS